MTARRLPVRDPRTLDDLLREIEAQTITGLMHDAEMAVRAMGRAVIRGEVDEASAHAASIASLRDMGLTKLSDESLNALITRWLALPAPSNP